MDCPDNCLIQHSIKTETVSEESNDFAFWMEAKSRIDDLVNSLAKSENNKDGDSQHVDDIELKMKEIHSRKRTSKGISKHTNHSPDTVESEDVRDLSNSDSNQLEEQSGDNDMNLSVVSDDVILILSNFPKWSSTRIKEYMENECGPIKKIEILRSENKFRIPVILTFKDSLNKNQAVEKFKDKYIDGEKLVIQQLSLDSSPSEPQTKRPKSEDEISEKDVDDQDPRGLYGLNPEYLKSLNIRPPIDKWVHVTNFRCDRSELKPVFEIAGKVIKVITKMTINRYAKVMYSHPLEAVQAISMLNGQKFYGQHLHVSMDVQPPDAFMLPTGLSGVGPGLGIEGKPVIDIVKQYQRYVLGKKSTINTSLFLQSDDLPPLFFNTRITSDSPNAPSNNNLISDSNDVVNMNSESTNQLSEQASLNSLSAQSGQSTPQISVQGSSGLQSIQSSMKNTDDVQNVTNFPKANIEQVDVNRMERSDTSGSPGPPGVNPPSISPEFNVGGVSVIPNSARLSGSNSVSHMSGHRNLITNSVQSMASRANSSLGNCSGPVGPTGPVCPTAVPGPGRPVLGPMGPAGPSDRSDLSGPLRPIPPSIFRPGPVGSLGPIDLGSRGPGAMISSGYVGSDPVKPFDPMGFNAGLVSSAMRNSVRPVGAPGGVCVPGAMGFSGPKCPPISMGPPGTIRPAIMGPSNPIAPGFGTTIGLVRSNQPCGPMGSMIRDPRICGSTSLNNRPRMEQPFTSATVQFSNLPPNTTFPVLCEKLTGVGQLMTLQFTTPGCVVATFANFAQAEKCVQMFNKITVGGYVIDVKFVPK